MILYRIARCSTLSLSGSSLSNTTRSSSSISIVAVINNIIMRIEEEFSSSNSHSVLHRIKIKDSSPVNRSNAIISIVGVPSSKLTTTMWGHPQHHRTMDSSKTSSRVNIVLNPKPHQMATSSQITTLSMLRKEYIIIIFNQSLYYRAALDSLKVAPKGLYQELALPRCQEPLVNSLKWAIMLSPLSL